MALRDWRDVIFEDLPKTRPITEMTRQTTMEYARRGVRTDVRVAMGLFPTDAEYEVWRRDSLATPLP